MKRFMLWLAFLISVGTSVWGQDDPSTSNSKEVDLTVTEGEAAKSLSVELGEDINNVTHLTVKGPLTVDDFTTLKNMARLQVLDMSGVTALPETETTWHDETNTNVKYKGIPKQAFQNKLTLRAVTFPACMEVIDYEAFSGCSSLGEIVFAQNNILKYLEGRAFEQCSGLKGLDLTACGGLLKISGQAFCKCTNLIEVNLSGCSALTAIESSAFYSCGSLQTVNLSSCTSLLSIGNSVFSGCTALTTVTLTDCSALKTIESSAFQGTSKLNTFAFDALTALEAVGDRAFQSSGLSGEILLGHSVKEIGESAFEYCQQLTKISFEANSQLAAVSAYTFRGCYALQTVNFSNCSALGTMGSDVFMYCESLQAIEINNNYFKSEDGVLFVVDMATLMTYPYAKTAEQYTIPNTVKTISTHAFYFNKYNYSGDDSPLKELTIPSSVETIQPEAFSEFRGRTVRVEAESPITLSNDIGLAGALVYVPQGKLGAYKNAEVWKTYTLIETGAAGTIVELTSAGTLASKLTGADLGTIQELTVTGPMNANDFEVIKQMTLLTKVDLSGVTMEGNKLPNNAFRYLSYLQTVILPNNLESIGNTAFHALTNLVSVNLPSQLKTIGSNAFQDCSNLSTMDLSSCRQLTVIEDNAFGRCGAIPEELVLPSSIQRLGYGAFYNTAITKVNFANTSIQYIDQAVFDQCNITGNLVLPASMECINNMAFATASFESIKLKSPKKVELGNAVFESTNKTTCTVYVPKGLGEIYKADTYWSPFGNNIVEYGYLVTATTNNSSYGAVSGGGAYEEGEQVTLTAKPHESVLVNGKEMIPLFAGWYKGNQKISPDLVYSFTMGTEDLQIEARFYVDNTNIGDGSTIDDSNKIDGTNVTFSGRLIVDGSLTWNLNRFSFNWVFSSSLLVNSPMSATTIEVKAHPEELAYHWNFISLPYDVKISDIGKPYESSQFVIRYYDGASRAANGMGGSWKQLGANDVMKANQGYIMMPNGGSPDNDVWYTFNSSIGDMNKLFNRQAVTIDLPAHPSTVSANANWNLVGNPFPCYFSVEQLFDDGLEGTVTVWSDELQNYAYYTQDDANVYLAPLTAFFIQHSGSTSSVTFKPEGRVAALPTTRAALSELRSDNGREVINLQLANDSLSDKTRVVFNEAASIDYELGKDAAKFSSMNNNAPSLYSLDAQNQQLAINERPVGNGVVRLGCYIGVKGSYTLSAKEALASDLYLYDTETGASCNLRETSYTFTAEAGVCNNRFELRTSLKGTDIEAIAGFSWQVAGDQLQLNGLPVGATVSLFDANGRMRFTGDAATAAAGIALPQSGIYYLTIRTAEGVSSTVSIKR